MTGTRLNSEEIDMSVKYFSINRPIGLGTYPNTEKVLEIMNFDKAVYCSEIGRSAWGYIVFENKLDEYSVKQYDLMEEGKIFYKLMCMQRAGGTKFANPIADYVPGKDTMKPEDVVVDRGKNKIVFKWFETLRDAVYYKDSHKVCID